VRIAHGPHAKLDPTLIDGTVAVVMHNDPFTTMEFVLEVLSQIFGASEARANELMTEIHRGGASVVAELPASVAIEHIADLRRRALAKDYPLRVTLERV
jgi:ATP-dependent Clp protease adaptor protein ClpS